MNFNQKTCYEVGIGLIYRKSVEGNQYLLLYSDSQKFWSPVYSERLEKESFREAVVREISWTLDLDRSRDAIVSNMALATHEFVDQDSEMEQQVTIAFYRARLFTQWARDQVEENSLCRWVSSKELCDGQLADGQVVDPKIVNWINRWSVIRPWE